MSVNIVSPELSLSTVIPEGIYNDSELFVIFMKAYYEWLQTAAFVLDNVTGTFVANEVVVGQTSQANALIRQVKPGELIVNKYGAFPAYERGETIVGQTSGATATLYRLTDNVLSLTSSLLDYRDVDTSVDKFSDYLKDELYFAIPSNYNGDTRFLAKKIRGLYQSKGQEQAYKFLMKLLFDQDIEITLPGKDILKVSDGNFVKEKILRANIIDETDTVFGFLFKTIKGRTSNALANVTDIKKTKIGTIDIVEMKLAFVSGEFIEGETIYDIADTSLTPLETTLYGMVAGYEIINSGSGYLDGDTIFVLGDGQNASVKISEVYRSGIDAITPSGTGHGYRLGTLSTVDNTDTGGSGFVCKVTELANTYNVTVSGNTYTLGEVSKVTVVNKGTDYYDTPIITLRDSTIYDLGLLSHRQIQIVNPGTNYTVGDTLTISSSPGAGAAGHVASVSPLTDNLNPNYANSYASLLLEDNSTLIEEQDFNTLKVEYWFNRGPISRLLLTNYGSAYSPTNLPTITVVTATGSSANLIFTGIQGSGVNVSVDVANNSGGIGAIRLLEPVNFGVDYSTATVNASTAGNGDANLVPIISGIAETVGEYFTDRGKLDYSKIQDSFYYQDYSYVIKSGLEIKKYRDVLKKLIHPAGLEVFGEISIVNQLNLSLGSLDPVKLLDVSIVALQLAKVISNDDLSGRPDLVVKKVNDFTASGLYATYAGVPISVLQDDYIAQYQYYTFNSPYGTSIYFQYTGNFPIAGTVSVFPANSSIVGYGTSFTDIFSGGDPIVVAGNRMVIDTVANNTFMTIKTNPEANLINQTAFSISAFIV